MCHKTFEETISFKERQKVPQIQQVTHKEEQVTVNIL